MLSILCNVNLGEEDGFRSSLKSYECLAKEDHVKNLSEINKSVFNELIGEVVNVFKETAEAKSRLERLKKTIISSLSSSSESDRRIEYVSLAVSCLQSFAQVNWLGPVPRDLLNLPSAIHNKHESHTSDNSVFNLVDHFALHSQV